MNKIWKQEVSLESLQKLIANTLPEHLGIEFVEIGADFILAKMPVDHRTVQPFRILHGGASVVLSESLGSIAAMLCLEDVNTHGVVGIEVNANHLRQAKEGEWVYGKVSPVKVGRQMQVWNTEIYNEAKKMVCTSRLTVAVIEVRPSLSAT